MHNFAKGEMKMEKMDFFIRFLLPDSVGVEAINIEVEEGKVSHLLLTEFRDKLFELLDEVGCSYDHYETRC